MKGHANFSSRSQMMENEWVRGKAQVIAHGAALHGGHTRAWVSIPVLSSVEWDMIKIKEKKSCCSWAKGIRLGGSLSGKGKQEKQTPRLTREWAVSDQWRWGCFLGQVNQAIIPEQLRQVQPSPAVHYRGLRRPLKSLRPNWPTLPSRQNMGTWSLSQNILLL